MTRSAVDASPASSEEREARLEGWATGAEPSSFETRPIRPLPRVNAIAFIPGMTMVHAAKRRSIHHQHVEDHHRRKTQDHRPDAERPKNVLGAKALLFPLFRQWIVLSSHDAPAFCVIVLAGRLIRDEL